MMLASFIEDEMRPLRRPTVPDEKEQPRSSWALCIDNDLFALSSRDRDYTGGFSLTLSGSDAATHRFSLDGALGAINRVLPITPTSDDLLHSFEVGVNAFTPEKSDEAAPQQGDRPYASLLYIANSRQQLNRRNRSSVITTLTIGALGLNIGGAL